MKERKTKSDLLPYPVARQDKIKNEGIKETKTREMKETRLTPHVPVETNVWSSF